MKKRLFIALDLSVEVVEKLVRFQEELHAQLPENVAFRWTDPRNVHVTLKYFGEVNAELVPFISEKIVELAKPLFSFEIAVIGLGAFDDIDAPRILWAGLDQQGGEVLGLLQQTIDKEMAEIGFPRDDRPFKPHVTLGRVKSSETVSMKSLAEGFSKFEFGSCFVRDLALFESELTVNGPKYTVIDRFPL